MELSGDGGFDWRFLQSQFPVKDPEDVAKVGQLDAAWGARHCQARGKIVACRACLKSMQSCGTEACRLPLLPLVPHCPVRRVGHGPSHDSWQGRQRRHPRNGGRR